MQSVLLLSIETIILIFFSSRAFNSKIYYDIKIRLNIKLRFG